MNKPDLQAPLDRLRAELKQGKFSDEGARLHAQHLVAEIEEHVAGTGSSAQQREDLTANISNAIRRFEVEHPAFTAYLGEIAAALG